MPHSLALLIALLVSILPHANAATPAEVVAEDLMAHGVLERPRQLQGTLVLEDGSEYQKGDIVWAWHGQANRCTPYSMGPVQYFVHIVGAANPVRVLNIMAVIPNTVPRSENPTLVNANLLVIIGDIGPNNTVDEITNDEGVAIIMERSAAFDIYQNLLSCYPLATPPKAKKRR